MRISTGIIATLAAAGTVLTGAGAAAAADTSKAGAARCAPARPGYGFYEAGRVASAPVTVPDSACSTISVSHVRDARDPGDRCQTFLVAFLADGGEVTYTDPVEACATPPGRRTVLAAGVPDGAVFRVLYQVDYIEPEVQRVRFTVWR
ncbi:hypothetical protein [Actinoplanes sp. NPDC049802]|uniref:hypothetical protein n=1 Tax=Actinoplanes sp. NPDC049802 TaxID=3154742 RepID=UPI0033D3B929